MRNRPDESCREICRPLKSKGNKEQGEEGFVLIIVLIIIAALALLGLAANRNMLTDIGIAQNHGGNTKSFYAAEAAAEYSYSQFALLLNQGTVPTQTSDYTNAVPAVGCQIKSAKATAVSYGPTPSVQRTITSSTPRLSNYVGLSTWVTQYTITATAMDPSTNASSTVTFDATKYLVPIFQFGIFYNNDLEMNPGANLTIPVNGWIHTNTNLYTSTSATETINSHITSVGNIDHGRAPNDTTAVSAGAVKIEGADGQYHNLADGSQTLNNGVWTDNSTNWASTIQQWGTGSTARVANSVQPLTLPLPAAATNGQSEYSGSEYILSQSGPQTMASQAAVTITDGVAKDAAGNTLSTNGSITTSSTVYDYRQGTTAHTITIDVKAFQGSAAGQALAAPSNGGTAGVLYATSANTSQYMAVRLTDGGTLSSPLTVATDLPAYVQGNFNQGDANHPVQPASIMSDATTVLSNQWQDSYSSSTDMSNRKVTAALTINADVMTGNSATTQQNGYGGGFENFIRFLENWQANSTTQNFNFGGSLVCMWQSQKATGKWVAPGTYYQPPNRNYTFGVFGANWPPGTPNAIVVTKGTWRQQ